LAAQRNLKPLRITLTIKAFLERVNQITIVNIYNVQITIWWCLGKSLLSNFFTSQCVIINFFKVSCICLYPCNCFRRTGLRIFQLVFNEQISGYSNKWSWFVQTKGSDYLRSLEISQVCQCQTKAIYHQACIHPILALDPKLQLIGRFLLI